MTHSTRRQSKVMALRKRLGSVSEVPDGDSQDTDSEADEAYNADYTVLNQ